MIKIRKIKREEIHAASDLIRVVFEGEALSGIRQNARDYFYEMSDDGSILKRFTEGSLIMIAEVDGIFAGYIEITAGNHIYMLFVKKGFQNQGLGKKLIDCSLILLKKNNPEVNEVTVNSTGEALNFYLKSGFENIADYQFKNGILSYPMRLRL